MENNMFYKKVFIKDVSDLPKEKGIYLFSRRNERFYLYKPFDPESKNSDPQGWVNLFDWYLLPVESTLRDEQIKTILKDFNKFMCGKQYDGRILLIDTCINEYLDSRKSK